MDNVGNSSAGESESITASDRLLLPNISSSEDALVDNVIRLSIEEEQQRKQRQLQEEEDLKRILELSLLEK